MSRLVVLGVVVLLMTSPAFAGRIDADLKDLPAGTEEVRLRGRFGYGDDKVTDEGIAHLTRYTKLRVLHAGGLELTDRALESIGKLSALEELRLDSNKISGSGLVHLTGLKSLRRLDLNFNPLSPESFITLANLSELTELSVLGNYAVTDQILELCSRLSKLRTLHLSENTSAVTDRGLTHLAKLTQLENLALRGASQISDAGLAQLTELPRLQRLSLRGLRSLTPEGLKVVGKLTELRRLELDEVPVDEATVQALAPLQKLEHLLLWNVSSGSPSLDGLGELKALRELRTNQTLSSSAIRRLAKLERLESITDELTEITDEDLTHLARLPRLKTLILGSEAVTAASLPTLARMQSLEALSVTEHVKITPEQWTQLGKKSLPRCQIARFRPPYTVYHEAEKKDPDAKVRVSGRLISSQYAQLGGRIERSIIKVTKTPGDAEVVDKIFGGWDFQFDLPPGLYNIQSSANGSRGATFKVDLRKFEIQSGATALELGDIDLPITRTTALFDQPAPELTGIVGWKNTQPLSLADLRGKVVLLDFFAQYCSICHAHKPDLARLLEKYGPQGLVVLAIHDETLTTMAEFDEVMGPILSRVFKGKVPPLPMALDGTNGVFRNYGIGAVPAMILIDPQGRVVRRFHHAGVPELEPEIQRLLKLKTESTVAASSPVSSKAEQIVRWYAHRDLQGLQQLRTDDYQALSPNQRNQVALAAAKSLAIESYLKAAGIEFKSPMDQVLNKKFAQPATQDTPAEAECRRQWGINMHAAELLRHLAEERRLTEQQVLPYLIAALDHADGGSVGQECFYALKYLTRRTSGDIYWGRLVRDDARHAEITAWWRQWWKTNQEKRLIVDPELENAARQEVLRLSRKIESLKPKFPELEYFKTPAELPLVWQRPLFYVQYDPSMWALRQGMFDNVNRQGLPWVLVTCRFRTQELPDKEDHQREPAAPQELSRYTTTCYSKAVLNSDLVAEVIVASPTQNLTNQVQGLMADLDTQPAVKQVPASRNAPAPTNYAGPWRMFMPSGFEHETMLTLVAENRYQLQAGRTRFTGLYELRGKKLGPAEDGRAGYVWEVRSPHMLVLVEQPNIPDNDYRGTILFRPRPAATKEP